MALSVRDTYAFVTALLRPAAPGSVLRAAARDFKRGMKRRPPTA
jgi:hypothetical protein